MHPLEGFGSCIPFITAQAFTKTPTGTRPQVVVILRYIYILGGSEILEDKNILSCFSLKLVRVGGFPERRGEAGRSTKQGKLHCE